MIDPLDINLHKKLSFTDLSKIKETNKNIEEALLKKNPKIEEDDELNSKMEGLTCPDYLKKIIFEEMKIEEIKKKNHLEEMKNKPKILRIRVHYHLEVKTIMIDAKNSFSEFSKKVFDTYKITNEDNCRLRLFNRIRDEMLDDFKGKYEKTLSELKIFSNKCFIVEEKKSEEQFEEYDPTVGNKFDLV